MTDLASLMPRLFISMVIVIAVMWIASRILNKRNASGKGFRLPGGGSTATAGDIPAVQVLARQSLGRRQSVTIVRTGGKTLVLGVTESNISLVTELESQESAHGEIETVDVESVNNAGIHWTGVVQDADASSQAWKGLLSQVRERTVRR